MQCLEAATFASARFAGLLLASEALFFTWCQYAKIGAFTTPWLGELSARAAWISKQIKFPELGETATGDALQEDMRVHPHPVFVHVPKNAGTAIEDAFLQQGMRLGRYAFELSEKAPYALEDISCSSHHVPPAEHIRNGFVVVRDPLDRLVSEFCWAIRFDWFRRYTLLYGLPEAEYSCKTLNSWLEVVLDLYEKKGEAVQDCHLIPQWRYASKVDNVLRMTKDLQQSIQDLHPSLANLTLQHPNGMSPACVVNKITPACFSEDNLIRIHTHFREDYANLGQALESSLSTGWTHLGAGCCAPANSTAIFREAVRDLVECKRKCMSFHDCGFIQHSTGLQKQCTILPHRANCFQVAEEACSYGAGTLVNTYRFVNSRSYRKDEHVEWLRSDKSWRDGFIKSNRGDGILAVAARLQGSNVIKSAAEVRPYQPKVVGVVAHWTSSSHGRQRLHRLNGHDDGCKTSIILGGRSAWLLADFRTPRVLSNIIITWGHAGTTARDYDILVRDVFGRQHSASRMMNLKNISYRKDVIADVSGVRTSQLKIKVLRTFDASNMVSICSAQIMARDILPPSCFNVRYMRLHKDDHWYGQASKRCWREDATGTVVLDTCDDSSLKLRLFGSKLRKVGDYSCVGWRKHHKGHRPVLHMLRSCSERHTVERIASSASLGFLRTSTGRVVSIGMNIHSPDDVRVHANFDHASEAFDGLDMVPVETAC
eukprot:TRINITY_DN102787_c0_g1_i1.p1 TRINITY_DN102787_c0_g1~~TRINITY_DN102787_c0_g1_i1.p1  ORF type:complete len:712 (+),score=75.81 TRINITY_DN102787_c0_g1_i1:86-2221(+)